MTTKPCFQIVLCFGLLAGVGLVGCTEDTNFLDPSAYGGDRFRDASVIATDAAGLAANGDAATHVKPGKDAGNTPVNPDADQVAPGPDAATPGSDAATPGMDAGHDAGTVVGHDAAIPGEDAGI